MANKIESEFITYEQALALKELGFDEEVFQRFTLPDMDEFCKHPLKQQVFRWFREKYGLCTIIDETVRPNIINKDSKLLFQYTNNKKYAGFEYEEAENACIDKLIELINNK